MTQLAQHFLIERMDERFAPRREQHANLFFARRHPSGETPEASLILTQLGARVVCFGEGTIAALVIATRKRPAIKDGPVRGHIHFKANESMRKRTEGEASQGPMTSETSSP